jgi:membrane protein required for colicin V production
MTTIDIVLLAIILFEAIKGFRKGFIHQLFSLAAWFLGVFLAIKLGKVLLPLIYPSPIHAQVIAKIVAFLGIFIIVVILVIIAGKLLSSFFEDTELNWLMKFSGAIFGALKCAFLLSIFMILLHISIIKWNWPSEKIRQESIFYQPIESIAPSIFVYLKTITAENNEEKGNQGKIDHNSSK